MLFEGYLRVCQTACRLIPTTQLATLLGFRIMHGALRMCAAMTFSSDSSASFLSRCSRTVAADRGGCCGGGGVDDMAADVVCALNSAPNLRTVSTFQITKSDIPCTALSTPRSRKTGLFMLSLLETCQRKLFPSRNLAVGKALEYDRSCLHLMQYFLR